VVTTDGAPSRRAFLSGAGAALAGVGAVALGGCGSAGKAADAPGDAPQPLSPAVAHDDVAILTRALDLERRTVTAYVAAIPLLPRPEAHAANQFLADELEHAGQLIGLIRAAGGIGPPRADSYPFANPPTTPAQVLALLHSLESQQIGLYLRAIPRLAPGPIRAAVSSILTVDAEHVTLLRLQQGQTPVPGPFVTGSE
jgi:hypothetical protein